MVEVSGSNGRRALAAVVFGAVMVLAAAACGSSSSASSANPSAGGSSAATHFGTAKVAGLGPVLVDGRGRTVYLLTADGHTNVPCDDASGCTKVWPDLPLPDGVHAATAGSGVDAALLGTKKLADGETYPTYHGWLLYEFANDTAAGQANGQGLQSFGGTWYAVSPDGAPVTTTSSTTASQSAGGY